MTRLALRSALLRSATVVLALATGALSASAADALRGLIDVAGLKARLGQANVVVVDIRSGETREKGAELFAAGHIPGAVHADYAHASWRLPREKTSVYLPEPAQFEVLAGSIGVSNDSHVVIVHEGADATSFGAAARAYWTFKAFGHASIAILDGGYRGWTLDKANPVVSGPSKPVEAFYEAKPVQGLRASLDEVIAVSKSGGAQLVDSRPETFFSGAEKHKAVKHAGHIPGSVNVPHARAIGPDFRVKDRASLESAFASVGTGPTIAYCNTGHWAATDWFILSEVLGRTGVKMYDGSMLEYAAEERAPVSLPKSGKGS